MLLLVGVADVVVVRVATARRCVVSVALHIHRLVLLLLVVVAVAASVQRLLLRGVQMGQMGVVVARLLDALLDVVRYLLGSPLQPSMAHGTRLALRQSRWRRKV